MATHIIHKSYKTLHDKVDLGDVPMDHHLCRTVETMTGDYIVSSKKTFILVDARMLRRMV